jgi:hypothetical protein
MGGSRSHLFVLLQTFLKEKGETLHLPQRDFRPSILAELAPAVMGIPELIQRRVKAVRALVTDRTRRPLIQATQATPLTLLTLPDTMVTMGALHPPFVSPFRGAPAVCLSSHIQRPLNIRLAVPHILLAPLLAPTRRVPTYNVTTVWANQSTAPIG